MGICMSEGPQRRFPVGAELVSGGGVHLRVWAPRARKVDVVFEEAGSVPLLGEADGYFSATAAGTTAGSRYRFRIDGDKAYPDPASRFQPDGPHGPSEVVDPCRYPWSDA